MSPQQAWQEWGLRWGLPRALGGTPAGGAHSTTAAPRSPMCRTRVCSGNPHCRPGGGNCCHPHFTGGETKSAARLAHSQAAPSVGASHPRTTEKPLLTYRCPQTKRGPRPTVEGRLAAPSVCFHNYVRRYRLILGLFGFVVCLGFHRNGCKCLT